VSAFTVATFKQQSLSAGTEASALAFIQIKTNDERHIWGAGVDTNIELASIKAVISAVNRAATRPAPPASPPPPTIVPLPT
jgi:2-isopropylmalate synthase